MTREEIIATVRGNNRVVVWLTEKVAYRHIPFNGIRVVWNKPEAAIELVKKTVSELGLSADDILFVEGVNGIAVLDPEWDGSDTFVCEDTSCNVAHSVDQAVADRLFLEVFPDWLFLGDHALEAGDFEKAVECFRGVAREPLRLKPSCATSWYNLGRSYGWLGQHDQAVGALQEAIRLKPDLAEAWTTLGIEYDEAGQYDQAVRAYKEATRLWADDAQVWYVLGNAHGQLGQYEQAIKAYQEAIRLKPDLARTWFNPWYNLGDIYSRQGNRSKVMEVYEKLKTLDPKGADEFLQKFVTAPSPCAGVAESADALDPKRPPRADEAHDAAPARGRGRTGMKGRLERWRAKDKEIGKRIEQWWARVVGWLVLVGLISWTAQTGSQWLDRIINSSNYKEAPQVVNVNGKSYFVCTGYVHFKEESSGAGTYRLDFTDASTGAKQEVDDVAHFTIYPMPQEMRQLMCEGVRR